MVDGTNETAGPRLDEIPVTTELREGSGIFRSTGFTVVKVTRDGVLAPMRFKIHSTGVAEVVERLRRDEPKPPRKPVSVAWDSEAGRALGMRKGDKRVVTDFDFTDPGYVKAREDYNETLGLEIVDAGLELTVRDEAGGTVVDRDRKLAILRGLGLTVHQFQQIVSDIQALTAWDEEERRAFFTSGSGSARTTSST